MNQSTCSNVGKNALKTKNYVPKYKSFKNNTTLDAIRFHLLLKFINYLFFLGKICHINILHNQEGVIYDLNKSLDYYINEVQSFFEKQSKQN